MSLLNLLGIQSAYAQTAAAPAHASPAGMFSPLLLMVIFIGVFYFLIIRPQNRKRKEQAQMLDALALGDEVVTIGGIMGRVAALNDDFIKLTIADNTTIQLQRSAVGSILPKGTLDA